MRKPILQWHWLRQCLLALLFVLPMAVGADGIGGTGHVADGIGGTGHTTDDGIGGTGHASTGDAIMVLGVVQKFGSIFVNGHEYHLPADTRYFVDDAPATKQRIKLGNWVVMTGSVTANGVLQAHEVHIEHALIGKIDQVNLQAGTIRVLGQTIVLNDATLLMDEAGHGVVATTFEPGDMIKVSGLQRKDGDWLALRITREAPVFGSRFLVRGILTGRDMNRVQVSGQWIALAVQQGSSSMAIGQTVTVSGVYVAAQATAQTIVPWAQTALLNGQLIDMSGYVNRTDAGWSCNGFRLAQGDASLEQVLRLASESGKPIAIVGNRLASGLVRIEEVHLGILPMQYGLSPNAVRQSGWTNLLQQGMLGGAMPQSLPMPTNMNLQMGMPSVPSVPSVPRVTTPVIPMPVMPHH